MTTWKDWAAKFVKAAESTQNPKPVRPDKEAKCPEIVRDLDKKAREDSVTPGLAVQERQDGVVKVSSYEFYEKVAGALCALKTKKKLSQFKK